MMIRASPGRLRPSVGCANSGPRGLFSGLLWQKAFLTSEKEKECPSPKPVCKKDIIPSVEGVGEKVTRCSVSGSECRATHQRDFAFH